MEIVVGVVICWSVLAGGFGLMMGKFIGAGERIERGEWRK